MRYNRSVHRDEFDARVAFLRKKARRADRFRTSDSDIRDLVFQSTIFLTGAATESYIKLVLETWIQRVKRFQMGASAPSAARAFFAFRRLEKAFSQFQHNKDEKELCNSLQSQQALWPLLAGDATLPSFFDGKTLHDGASYPSIKNINRLFARIGIGNMVDRLSSNLSRDVEIMVDGFQSVRTALAHSTPPTITLNDVEKLLDDSISLVGALDRILHGHVMAHGGRECWPS